MAIITKKRT